MFSMWYNPVTKAARIDPKIAESQAEENFAFFNDLLETKLAKKEDLKIHM